MMTVSMVWMVCHYLALITLMICYHSGTHLSHWDQTYLADPTIFYGSTFIVLLLGPISIFALSTLPIQVKAQVVEMEGVDHWNPSIRSMNMT